SVNGLTCSSSPLGSGRAAWKRRNASSMSACGICGSLPAAAVTSAAARFLGPLTRAALPARARRRPSTGFPAALRVGLRTGLRDVLRAITFGIMSAMVRDNDPAREPTIFSAVLTPHRSLGRKGFLALMLVLGGASFVTGMVFLMAGAWPVFGFCGLD